jgi:hypothetical protein
LAVLRLHERRDETGLGHLAQGLSATKEVVMAEKSRLTVEEIEALRERILRRLGESTRLREELGQYQLVLCELG